MNLRVLKRRAEMLDAVRCARARRRILSGNKGGWIDLPQKKTFVFHGFSLEVSKIGFGTEEDGSSWTKFRSRAKLKIIPSRLKLDAEVVIKVDSSSAIPLTQLVKLEGK